MKVIPFTPVGDVFVWSTSVLPAWTSCSLRITAVDDDKERPGRSFLLRRPAAGGPSPSSSQLGALLAVVWLPSARRRPGHVPPQASGGLEGGERLYVVEQEWQESTIRSFSRLQSALHVAGSHRLHSHAGQRRRERGRGVGGSSP